MQSYIYAFIEAGIRAYTHTFMYVGRHTVIDRHSHIHVSRAIDLRTGRQSYIYRQENVHTCRQVIIQAASRTASQSYWQSYMQSYKQVGIQASKHTPGRQTVRVHTDYGLIVHLGWQTLSLKSQMSDDFIYIYIYRYIYIYI